MNETRIRHRPLLALIIGASGRNVLPVMTAFEQRRIAAVREDTIASACERIAIDLPEVILVLVPPATDAERDALADRALAVGALLVHIAPNLEPDAIRQILERTIATALERKVIREEAAPRVDEGGDAEPPAEPSPDVTAQPSSEDVDAGWET